MNKKILKILEFGEITKRLSELAITEPAKKEAERLVPSDHNPWLAHNAFFHDP